MTKRWKLKTNSANILLVLITLILVKAEWVKEENDSIWKSTSAVESIIRENQIDHTHTYVGNDEIAEYFFHSSVNNSSIILNGINKCLDNFQLITCAKMLLLSRVNDVLSFMEEPNFSQKDVRLLNGILIFKIKNKTNETGFSEKNADLSLNEEIAVKVKKIFWNRSLLVNLMPKVEIEIEPSSGQREEDFVCFKYSIRNDLESESDGQEDFLNEGRKKKGGGMSMMMIVPQLIMLGLMPFTLASLKAMVMNAVMINMMALNGAIFMTIRNLVFGPRQGDNVKYVNYGYSKDRQTQSPKPVLIIHSPAAFVKQPPVSKKQVYGHSSHYFPHTTLSYFPQSHYSNASSFHHHNAGKIKGHMDDFYYIQQDASLLNRRQQGIQEGNEPEWITDRDKINTTREVRVQNKKIYQRKFKQEAEDRRQNWPSLAQTPEKISYKTNPNFIYTNVDVKARKSLTKYQAISQRRGPDKGKTQLKPSP